MPFDFKEQLEAGKSGEEVVIEHFRETMPWASITDLRVDGQAQNRDIDFHLGSVEGMPFLGFVEVKTDTHSEDNMFIELSVGSKPGWLFRSAADHLVYFFIETGALYIIPLPELRLWMHLYLDFYLTEDRNREKRIVSSSNGRRWITIGVTIPSEDILKGVPGAKRVEI